VGELGRRHRRPSPHALLPEDDAEHDHPGAAADEKRPGAVPGLRERDAGDGEEQVELVIPGTDPGMPTSRNAGPTASATDWRGERSRM
jgi:hypothetical protein